MKVYIVYKSNECGSDALVSVHKTEEGAKVAIEKMDTLFDGQDFYWAEELVQD
jgi:hypothetical protein